MKLELGERERPVIVFTVAGRFDYLAATLTSWEKVRGIEDATMIFLVEPSATRSEVPLGCLVCADFCRQALVSINRTQLGVAGNPWHAMQTGFRLADWVILAEEDITPSTDALEYLAWGRDEYRADPLVKAVCCGQLGPPLGGEDEVLRSKHFTPHIWGTWAHTWRAFFRDTWGSSVYGWDCHVNDLLRAGPGQVVIPARSRSAHIGVEGTFCNAEIVPGTVSKSWQPEFGPQAYRQLARVPQREGE